MNGLSIDQAYRRVHSRPCPSCRHADDIVTGIVRRDGRALIDYDVRFHTSRVEAFVDIGLILEGLEDFDFDGPDGYCVVFSCWIGNGQTVLIDAPAVSPRDDGWREYLSREDAVTHYRRDEWRSILDFLLLADPILERIDIRRP